jgi:hypothetical protein
LQEPLRGGDERRERGDQVHIWGRTLHALGRSVRTTPE